MHSRLRPSPAMVIALTALFVSLGGTAAALSGSNTVFSDDIVNNEVKTGDVRNDTLSGGGLAATDLAPNAVGASEVATNGVGTSEVADNSLTGTDVNESTLLTVPSATFASAATNSNLLDGVSSENFASVVTPGETDSGTAAYIRFPSWITGSAPPSVDCDAAQETGRITVRDDGTTNLYICTGTGGWVGK